MATGRKILGLTFLAIGVGLSIIGVYLLLSPSQYKATARIKITEPPVPPGQEPGYDPYFIQVEFSKMQSEIVLGNVVTNLHLDETWARQHNNGRPLRLADITARLRHGMEFRPEWNTRIIDVSFTSHDPQEAAGVANAIVEAYRAYRIQQAQTNTMIGIRALEEDHQRTNEKISAAEDNLDQLRKQLSVPSPEPSPAILESNYPSYFQKKQELQNFIYLNKLLQAKIANEKVNLQLGDKALADIQIVDAAQPPKYPVKPNRYLGIILFIIGLMISGLGGWLMKPTRSPSRSGAS